MHEAFTRMARARPDAVALICGHVKTTYAELDARSDAWAAELVSAGSGPASCVPILLPRSAEVVTALLAVLKTGAAYALLDPHWPAHRLEAGMEDVGAVLVIATDAALGGARSVWSPTVAGAGTVDFRAVAAAGSDPCCVFFTSGTTGRPKAVLTPHRATARLFQQPGFARFDASTVMPLASSTPWDAFSLELWSVLLNGGTSWIVEEPYLGVEALRTGVSAHGVDTVWLTSSLFNMLVDEDCAAFMGVRQVMVGGERLSVPHVERFLERHPAIALINGYGPVESTVFATTHRIRTLDLERVDGIPLGRPVPGTQVYVLDGARPCAVGESGEICIGGDGLALRYLGDSALTEARFPHLWLDGALRRIYRTGDLGAWSEDGMLQFRGRADRQLKIRGHRVEPVEVEREIERLLPEVRTCRVVARSAADRSQEIVAFCILRDPDRSLEHALSALRPMLVPYQLPAAMIALHAFPLTAHGKLDERALLALAASGAASGLHASADPTDAADEMSLLVAKTFAAVLGRASVGTSVSFFELGGSSLAAGRVCARLACHLQRSVPLSLLYGHPRAVDLAAQLRSTAGSVSRAAASVCGSAVPLRPMQIVYLTRQLVRAADRTAHCLLVWALEGDLDRAALQAAVHAVHERHEALRAVYQLDPSPAARIEAIPAPPLEILAAQPSLDAALRALRSELAEDLQPWEGDVWRALLVPLREDPVALFGCVVHHVAFDGWSESLLAQDLSSEYNAVRGARLPSAPTPVSLAQAHAESLGCAVGRDVAARNQELQRELSDLPTLRWPPRSVPAQLGAPGRIALALERSVVAAVDTLASSLGVTRFVVLLFHFARSLAEITGERDLALGVPARQRGSTILERAIGCHIEMLCIRLRGGALGEGLAAIRETARAVRWSFAQDIPYRDLLELLDPPRSDRPPLFQVLFALQDNPAPRLDLDGVQATFLRQPYLELPLELHAELWPDERGGLHVDLSFRRDVVCETTARELAKRFFDRLHNPLPGLHA